MNNILKILIVFICLFISSCGEKKYTNFSCKYKEDANACSDSCVGDDDYKFSFMINKENRSVMIKYYEKDKIYRSSLLENCKIFDEKNWDCSEDNVYSDRIHYRIKKMTSGIYTSINKTIDTTNYHDINEMEGTCGK